MSNISLKKIKARKKFTNRLFDIAKRNAVGLIGENDSTFINASAVMIEDLSLYVIRLENKCKFLDSENEALTKENLAMMARGRSSGE